MRHKDSGVDNHKETEEEDHMETEEDHMEKEEDHMGREGERHMETGGRLKQIVALDKVGNSHLLRLKLNQHLLLFSLAGL